MPRFVYNQRLQKDSSFFFEERGAEMKLQPFKVLSAMVYQQFVTNTRYKRRTV